MTGSGHGAGAGAVDHGAGSGGVGHSAGGPRTALPGDARVFLGRLTRVHPDALVRLRPAGPGRAQLWAYLPWGVLVTRQVAATVPGDRTVGAAALLAAAAAGEPMPPARDPLWRWPLPPGAGTVVEEIGAGEVRAVAAAAAGTLRAVTDEGLDGRPVGVRVLREALLDHVAVVVTPPASGAGAAAGDRIEIPQRLVQAVLKMGFLGTAADDPVRVRLAERWIGLAGRNGTAWLPPRGGLLVRSRSHPPR
jgi:hypothetical protein